MKSNSKTAFNTYVHPDLKRRFKILCIQKNKSISRMMEIVLTKVLDKYEEKAQKEA